MKIDNKPILSIYWLPSFLKNFGGVEGSRNALEALRSACIEAGFDGIVLLMEERNADSQLIGQMAEIGVDYCYSYTWIGNDTAKHKEMNRQQHQAAAAAGMNMLPMLSVGWEPSSLCPNPGEGWVPVPEYKNMATWFRDDFMPALPETSLGQRMIMIDNWNEFGEGHFIMPSNLAGFGYLDALRDVFTDGGPHEDPVPTGEQKKRFNTLFPRE